MTLSFEDLLARLQAGDDEAAARVFHRFLERLVALASTRLSRYVRQKVDPEDVVQSVYRTFFRRFAAGELLLKDPDGAWAVLALITLRKCANLAQHYRAARRDARREAPSPQDWQAAVSDPTPEEEAVVAETIDRLMDGLDEDEREMAALSLQGYPAPEISAKVGCSERTVRRVRERLRNRFERLRAEDAEEG
jgi:RNA polymerase sigma-70 factor, ECF subfamily